MADENAPADETNGQLELDFPSTDGFPDYDDVDSEVGQTFLPPDSYDGAEATDDEEGFGCVR